MQFSALQVSRSSALHINVAYMWLLFLPLSLPLSTLAGHVCLAVLWSHLLYATSARRWHHIQMVGSVAYLEG